MKTMIISLRESLDLPILSGDLISDAIKAFDLDISEVVYGRFFNRTSFVSHIWAPDEENGELHSISATMFTAENDLKESLTLAINNMCDAVDALLMIATKNDHEYTSSFINAASYHGVKTFLLIV